MLGVNEHHPVSPPVSQPTAQLAVGNTAVREAIDDELCKCTYMICPSVEYVGSKCSVLGGM